MKILIADDHALFRDGLRYVLRELDPDVEVFEAVSTTETLAIVETHTDLDLILLDLSMPGHDGFTALDNLRARYPEIPVVVVSATEDTRDIQRVMSAGAAGFIPKATPGPDIVQALLKVLAGETYIPPDIAHATEQDRYEGLLTRRQQEVLTLMCQGLPNKKIARQLGMAEGTVKIHVTAILRALEVDSRTQAVVVASQMGLCR